MERQQDRFQQRHNSRMDTDRGRPHSAGAYDRWSNGNSYGLYNGTLPSLSATACTFSFSVSRRSKLNFPGTGLNPNDDALIFLFMHGYRANANMATDDV